MRETGNAYKMFMRKRLLERRKENENNFKEIGYKDGINV
jgi:hypothetical protein